MRVGIIGKFPRESWCVGLAEAFINIGHTVLTSELTANREHHVRVAQNSDLMIVIKGSAMTHDHIRQLIRVCPGKNLFYTGDSITCGPGNRVEAIGMRALMFDHVALTGYEGCAWVREVDPEKPLAQIYQGVRHEVYQPRPPWDQHLTTEGVCFLGHYYHQDGGRREKIAHLEKDFKVLRSNDIYMEQAAERYFLWAVSPNFICGELTSSRVLRVMASGGFMLTETNKDIRRSFSNGIELATFDGSLKDLTSKVRYFMGDIKARRRIAERGRRKAKEYTWERQAQKMLDFVGGSVVADGAASDFIR